MAETNSVTGTSIGWPDQAKRITSRYCPWASPLLSTCTRTSAGWPGMVCPVFGETSVIQRLAPVTSAVKEIGSPPPLFRSVTTCSAMPGLLSVAENFSGLGATSSCWGWLSTLSVTPTVMGTRVGSLAVLIRMRAG